MPALCPAAHFSQFHKWSVFNFKMILFSSSLIRFSCARCATFIISTLNRKLIFFCSRCGKQQWSRPKRTRIYQRTTEPNWLFKLDWCRCWVSRQRQSTARNHLDTQWWYSGWWCAGPTTSAVKRQLGIPTVPRRRLPTGSARTGLRLSRQESNWFDYFAGC